ncbi:MAG: amino acid synthesis family protein [Proteobacteria bacterium]|nr:amino acid synthesis family protein [Pseudomonadota bacterium]
MPSTNSPSLQIRKWYLQVDDTFATESGESADGDPVRKIVVGVALRNAYAGRFVEDLESLVKASAELGSEVGRRLVEASGGAPICSMGKACLVGTAGDYEHGNALLTTVFADPIRLAIGGATAWIPSTGKRGAPGTVIDIPLAHKDNLYVRSHYDTISAMFPDAPNSDEIVIAFAVATRGRLHARLGGPTASQP